MRRLLVALAAFTLLAVGVAIPVAAQTIDPGTPTTISPAPSDGQTQPGFTGTAPSPPATQTAPAETTPPTETTPPPTETTVPPTTAGAAPPAATTPPPAAPAPAPATPAPEAAQSEQGGAPVGLVILIVLGALVVLVALVWAIAAWQGLEPPWWPRVRHSLAELGWRASGAWSDFTDWVRLGR
jgi:hypothetical protein